MVQASITSHLDYYIRFLGDLHNYSLFLNSSNKPFSYVLSLCTSFIALYHSSNPSTALLSNISNLISPAYLLRTDVSQKLLFLHQPIQINCFYVFTGFFCTTQFRCNLNCLVLFNITSCVLELSSLLCCKLLEEKKKMDVWYSFVLSPKQPSLLLSAYKVGFQ